ncbi:MAG: molybdopterin cofactor-binding domain-containing protein, partial [Geminicoccales bacterium]
MTNIQRDVQRNLPSISRRGFLGSAAGLSFAVAFGAKGLSLIPAAQATAQASNIGAWVRIAPDNRIVILTPGAEMGQGSMTGVPVALAEEMDGDWDKVSLEWAPADASIYGYKRGSSRSMLIAGSRAVMLYFDDMRIAGAQVRKVLLQAAAQKWGVDPVDLKTEPSVVLH